MSDRTFNLTEIKFQKVTPRNSHIGFVSFIFQGIKLTDIAVHRMREPKEGRFVRLVYPENGVKRVLFHPTDRTTSKFIESEVNKHVVGVLGKEWFYGHE